MAERGKLVLRLTAILLALLSMYIYRTMAGADAAGEGALLPGPYELQGGAYAMDLNSADKEMLACLPGIGVELADRIVEYRQTHGDFDRVEQLTDVYGIGETTLERVRPFLTVLRSGT